MTAFTSCCPIITATSMRKRAATRCAFARRGRRGFPVVRATAQMYGDWFIETCADWAVPYIGDLAGWQAVQAAGVPAQSMDADLLRWLAPRRDVANTLRHRRRKGTLPLLEELPRDVAGWPAFAVEVGFRDWLLGRPAEVHRHLDAATAPRTGSSSLAEMHDPRLLARLGRRAMHLPTPWTCAARRPPRIRR